MQRLELEHWPVGWKLAFDIADVLTLVVTADGNLDRVLAAWDAAEDPGAALHMAASRENVLRETSRTYFHSAYLDDHAAAADTIGAFLTRPEIPARLEAAFFMLEEPRLQKILSDAIYIDDTRSSRT